MSWFCKVNWAILSLCQISCQSVKTLLFEIERFKSFSKWRPSAMLYFHILTIGRVKRVSMRHRAKFRVDRSNHCWNMAISRFFDHRLSSWICACLGHQRRVLGGLYLCALIWLESIFNNMQVIIFGMLGLKMPIHAPTPQDVFLKKFYPKNWKQYQCRSPKSDESAPVMKMFFSKKGTVSKGRVSGHPDGQTASRVKTVFLWRISRGAVVGKRRSHKYFCGGRGVRGRRRSTKCARYQLKTHKFPNHL